MTLQQAYKNPSSASISLDTIISALVYQIGQESPKLKRNQSLWILRTILSKMWFPSHGNLFHGRLRLSHAALAAENDLCREWVCELVDRLRLEEWITTETRRLPNGQREITIFRPGPMLKWLLVKLLKSRQRGKTHVNDSSQEFLSEEERVKRKARFDEFVLEVAAKLGRVGRQREK